MRSVHLGWILNKDNKQGQEEKLDGCLDHHPEERSVHSAQEVAEESSATSGRSSSPGHCICSKFGHQVAPLALVPNLATLADVPNCTTSLWIALLALSVSIEFVSSSARVTSV